MTALTPERWALIEARFHDLLEAPVTARADLLTRLAAEDVELADEVRSLLEAEATGPLGRGDRGGDRELVAEYVGPYRLIRRLGEGGMGVVYLAEREEAGFRQRVALKLLRTGFLDPRLADQVAHERRVLARLEHPNIARLIDGGTTSSGQPYLAMEYVEGATLLEHAERENLSIAGRVRLMIEVCEAVNYAHQQLVVHRDLKPSNVVVGLEGRPRLLDFGVSKLMDPEERAQGGTRSTRWMTPAYASPEQFQGGTVTTLSDVYSLGVILYELLAGFRPYELDGRSPAEMERLLCEVEPPRPSDRCPDPRVARELRGDLDTIVLKALAKAPARRYASAEQVAEDLRRYLDGHPVLAQPDSLGYRARKFAQRHRVGVTVGVATMLLAVAGVVLVGRAAGIARVERDRAEAAREEAQQVTAYVIRLFETADASQSAVDTVAAQALLRQGVEQAEALRDQPLVQAAMFDALGMVFVGLQRYDQASELVGRAWQLRDAHLPAGHPDRAESLAHLGRILRSQSKFPEALERYEAALAIRVEAFGPQHPKVALSYRDLGFLMPYFGRNEESVQYYRKALAIDQAAYGTEHEATADDLRMVGLALHRTGRKEEALTLIQQALGIFTRVLGPEALLTTTTQFHAADALHSLGRDEEAEALFRAGIAARERGSGVMDPRMVHGLSNLAELLGDHDRGAEAEALLRRAIDIHRTRFGKQSVSYASALEALSSELGRQGRTQEALALRREALSILRAEFGDEHGAVATSLVRLADLLSQAGRHAEAEAAAREALDIRIRLFGPNQTPVGLAQLQLAAVLRGQRRLPEAEAAALAGFTIVSATQPVGHEDIRFAHRELARIYEAMGREGEAARHRELGK